MPEPIPQTVIGVDIAKRKFDVARLCEHKYRHRKFDNTPQGFAALLVWKARFGDAQPWICMEATGAYSIPLAEFLVEQGYRVSVVNPAKIHAFAKSELSRAKTDKADAKLIARYGLSMKPNPWTPPPRAIRELQALLRRVEHLLEMQQMERNRLDTADPAIIDSLKIVLAKLQKELDATRQRIKSLIDNDPDLKQRRHLLESIPGIGPTASAYLLTMLGTHHGFSTAKQVVAYVGLAPRPQESGQWVGKTRISGGSGSLDRNLSGLSGSLRFKLPIGMTAIRSTPDPVSYRQARNADGVGCRSGNSVPSPVLPGEQNRRHASKPPRT
jgi:transposase